MKLLLVTWFFPPANTMGALRLAKFAKYLAEQGAGQGHELRVVCARDLPFPQTLPVEVPPELVTWTRWRDVNGLPRAVQGFRRRLQGGAANPSRAPESPTADSGGGVLRKLSQLYTLGLNVPDRQVGWLPYALAGGRRVLRGFKPDLVFASAPPFTGLVAGAWLARAHGVPWVAEYRDRWSEDPYDELPPWRRRLDRWLEERLLRDARAIVTVSEPWAADYRARWGKPTAVIYNGFDPDDFPSDGPRGASDPDRLEIVYTGVLYPDRRDPTPLFRALASMGAEADGITARFFGSDPATLKRMAAAAGAEAHVEINGSVPYREAVRLQMQADVLLLLQWNDPREAGNVPGKLFEYLGARRPVLAIGYEHGVPAALLKERAAGVLLNDPAAIADQLRAWRAAKRAGASGLLPEAARAGLSRPEQFAKLTRFLEEVVRG